MMDKQNNKAERRARKKKNERRNIITGRILIGVSFILLLLYIGFFLVVWLTAEHSNYEYIRALQLYLRSCWVILIILCAFWIVCAIITIKRAPTRLFIFGFACLCALLIYAAFEMSLCYLDVVQPEEITYQGAFSKRNGKTSAWFYLHDGDFGVSLNDAHLEISPGDYEGEIIYARRSKIVLSFNIDSP